MRKPVDRPVSASAGEDERVLAQARLRADDVERDRRQHQAPGGILLALLLRDRPFAVVGDVGPSHGHDLRAALRCQQGNPHEGTECAVGFGRFPDRAQLVVGKDALAHLFLRVLAAHPLDDRRLVIVVPCRKPVHDGADNRQHGIGLSCAVIVLDVVEQGGDIAAPDREERSALPEMEDVQFQQAG